MTDAPSNRPPRWLRKIGRAMAMMWDVQAPPAWEEPSTSALDKPPWVAPSNEPPAVYGSAEVTPVRTELEDLKAFLRDHPWPEGGMILDEFEQARMARSVRGSDASADYGQGDIWTGRPNAPERHDEVDIYCLDRRCKAYGEQVIPPHTHKARN